MFLFKNDSLFFLWLLGSLLTLSGCVDDPVRNEGTGSFNIDSLLDAQIAYFLQNEVSVEKTVTMNGVTEKVVHSPGDSSAWGRELDAFRNINVLNKRVNQDLYVKDDGLQDTQSNLKVCLFSIEEEDLALQYLKIYYHESRDRLRKLEAMITEENALYASVRKVSMELNEVYGKTMITSYTVEGGQKMVLDDSLSFAIKASVIYH